MEVYMRFFISAKFIEENISGIVDYNKNVIDLKRLFSDN